MCVMHDGYTVAQTQESGVVAYEYALLSVAYPGIFLGGEGGFNKFR